MESKDESKITRRDLMDENNDNIGIFLSNGGMILLARNYKSGKFYNISGKEPEEITEETVKKILIYNKSCYEWAIKKGWWTESYKDYRKRIKQTRQKE